MFVGVYAKDGTKLMPTNRLGKVRHLLKDGLAVVHSRRPFAIRLTYETTKETQDIELCVDAGYGTIGVSAKTAKKEIFAAEFELLKDEKKRHDDQRIYRRTRRNRLRYREPRFDNRKKPEGWLAPSLEHKKDAHVQIIERLCAVMPVKSVVIEVGLFDPALLKAMETDAPIPEGVDYQHGPLYYAESLRQAVYQRDGYKCAVCGKDALHSKKPVHLHTHHALYWMGRHGDTLDELVTICEDCHTSANHAEGGKLWGMKPKHARLEAAAFMNAVRWQIVDDIKDRLGESVKVSTTYGAATSLSRKALGLEKTHATDAYCMGGFRPAKRAEVEYFKKRRRNNRVLSTFRDAKVIDTRTGEAMVGAKLGCERTNRRESRTSDKSLRKFRGPKVKKGEVRTRTKRHRVQCGDLVFARGRRWIAVGTMSGGASVLLSRKEDSPTGKAVTVSPRKLRILRHASGWVRQKMSGSAGRALYPHA